MTLSMKMVTLRSHDGEEFEIPINVAAQSKLVKNMLDDDVGDSRKVVPLGIVNSATLAKVIEYCKKHAEATTEDGIAANDAGGAEELKRWDAEFLMVDNDLLSKILIAADYMNIKNLFDLTCQVIADKLKNKTTEQLRQIFNIQNDFTPEEEEEIRKKYQWAFRD
ncbi:hypothetical protein K1719_041059 [Acacia pycnantha]|nr:hypothetical protein K1719_041059 [Acacia pycnantha]